MNGIDDGTYDAFVVDASDADDDGIVHLELAITSGAQKGATVRVSMRHFRGEPMSLLGLPATLRVDGGTPRVTFERG